MQRKPLGFTLIEVLIVLIFCGLLGIFTLPKILGGNASLAGKQSYGANQTITMLAAAYQVYRQDNIATVNTQPGNIMAYLNYLSSNTTSSIDDVTGNGSLSCSSSNICYNLHTGGKLYADNAHYFCNTTPSSYIVFKYDPDGLYSGLTTGGSKSIGLDLHFDGRVVESSQRLATDQTCTSAGSGVTGWGADPDSNWFTWKG